MTTNTSSWASAPRRSTESVLKGWVRNQFASKEREDRGDQRRSQPPNDRDPDDQKEVCGEHRTQVGVAPPREGDQGEGDGTGH